MIEQALSAAEWARYDETGDPGIPGVVASIPVAKKAIHAEAAILLDGEEFGFTWEDVRRHRAQAAMMRESVERWGDLAGGIAGATAIEESAALSAWHDSVADRLEALLRPEVSP